MSRKLSIIGRGTAGAFAITHFLRWTNWDIDWYFDDNIKPQAVGEGSNLIFPLRLTDNIGFTYRDLSSIDGTVKQSIYKKNWGTKVEDFHHNFILPNVAIHFNANKFQEFIFNKVKSERRIKIINENVSNKDSIDSDYILDCSGKPTVDDNFYASEFIPVNSVHVNQCTWDYPRFFYTLTIARPYGWVFGIPLNNRCSIGYMYDNNINTLEEVKEDALLVIKELNLIPSGITNSFTFNNYYRKNNFNGRIVYNGNASFFLEPLEATSISTMDMVQKTAYDYWNGTFSSEQANIRYLNKIKEIENVIMLHYFAGSIFNTKFWDVAKNKSIKNLQQALNNPAFEHIILRSEKRNYNIPLSEENVEMEYGTWGINSFRENIDNLGIRDKIYNFAEVAQG